MRSLGLFDPRVFGQTWPEPNRNPNVPYIVGLDEPLQGYEIPWTSDLRYTGRYVTALMGTQGRSASGSVRGRGRPTGCGCAGGDSRKNLFVAGMGLFNEAAGVALMNQLTPEQFVALVEHVVRPIGACNIQLRLKNKLVVNAMDIPVEAMKLTPPGFNVPLGAIIQQHLLRCQDPALIASEQANLKYSAAEAMRQNQLDAKWQAAFNEKYSLTNLLAESAKERASEATSAAANLVEGAAGAASKIGLGVLSGFAPILIAGGLGLLGFYYLRRRAEQAAEQ